MSPRGRHATLSLSLAALLAPAVAQAAITPARTDPQSTELAKTVAVDPALVTSATFQTIADPPAEPSGPEPVGLVDTPLGTFPRNGAAYAILTTGNVRIAADANDSGGSGVDLGMNTVAGPPDRGPNARDAVVWKLALDVPANNNCIVVRFRFLSEEFPEFVGSPFNDAFVAELDTTTWRTTSETNNPIVAPDNFAFDEQGNPVTINATGVSTATAENAAGTTYDGATRRLAAAKLASAGPHSLYLSIFDQGDGILDSAVFVDQLQTLAVDPAKCTSGAFFDDAAPVVNNTTPTSAPEPLVQNGQFVQDDTPSFGGKAGTGLNDNPNVTGSIYPAAAVRAPQVPGTPVQQKSAPVAADGSWTITADTLAEGSYTFQVSQGSSNGETGFGDPITFTVDRTGPKPVITPVGFAGKTRDTTPLLTGTSGAAGSDGTGVAVKLFAGKAATGTPLVSTSVIRNAAAWSLPVSQVLKDGIYTVVAEQGDAAGNLGGSAPLTFVVTTSNPIAKVKFAKRLRRNAAAKKIAGSLAFGFPGRVTYVLTAKIGSKTLKVGTVKRTLAAPGKAAFSVKPTKSVANRIRRSRGTITLRTTFLDDQNRTYRRTQKVPFR